VSVKDLLAVVASLVKPVVELLLRQTSYSATATSSLAADQVRLTRFFPPVAVSWVGAVGAVVSAGGGVVGAIRAATSDLIPGNVA
jgi:hypothetical protein